MAIVRQAKLRDLRAAADLLAAHRRLNEALEPRFWRASARAPLFTRLWLFRLSLRQDTLALVAIEDEGIAGMLIAAPARVPPVYDPGKTAMIDDFCVASPDRWPDIGAALLAHARGWLRDREYRQVIAVTAYRDAAKMALLERAGLSLTSAWWTGAA